MGIEERAQDFADQKRVLDSLERNRPYIELKKDEEYCKLKRKYLDTLRTFIDHQMKLDEKGIALPRRMDEQDAAKRASYRFFGNYCEERQLAELMISEPEDVLKDNPDAYENAGDVIEKGKELMKHTDNILILAQELYFAGMNWFMDEV